MRVYCSRYQLPLNDNSNACIGSEVEWKVEDVNIYRHPQVKHWSSAIWDSPERRLITAEVQQLTFARDYFRNSVPDRQLIG